MIQENLRSGLGEDPVAMNSCSVLKRWLWAGKWFWPSCSVFAAINVSYSGLCFPYCPLLGTSRATNTFMNPGSGKELLQRSWSIKPSDMKERSMCFCQPGVGLSYAISCCSGCCLVFDRLAHMLGCTATFFFVPLKKYKKLRLIWLLSRSNTYNKDILITPSKFCFQVAIISLNSILWTLALIYFINTPFPPPTYIKLFLWIWVHVTKIPNP